MGGKLVARLVAPKKRRVQRRRSAGYVLRRVTKRSACGSTPGGGAAGRSGACLSTGGRVVRVLLADVVSRSGRLCSALSGVAVPFIPILWNLWKRFLIFEKVVFTKTLERVTKS